jgi:hypothetical protein
MRSLEKKHLERYARGAITVKNLLLLKEEFFK